MSLVQTFRYVRILSTSIDQETLCHAEVWYLFPKHPIRAHTLTHTHTDGHETRAIQTSLKITLIFVGHYFKKEKKAAGI